MNKVAICFMTKDRVELSRKTLPALVGGLGKSETMKPLPFDLWMIDGSATDEGRRYPLEIVNQAKADSGIHVRHNVRGGPDAAVAYAVTECLAHGYEYIGIVENDVLLPNSWFYDTMALFDRARDAGFDAGAVSPRCYEDRILFQRDGYAVCHNLGFGCVIWSRQAARLMLENMRTSWTLENRRVFMDLAGVDIGTYWAFRTGEHMLCADWGVDRVLAAHGLASLALVPSKIEMIGQVPPLAEQGLTIATGESACPAWMCDDEKFKNFADTLHRIRWGIASYPDQRVFYQTGQGGWLFFAHQLGLLPGYEAKGWRLKWTQGFGPHSFRADEGAELTFSVSGPVSILVGGGEKGAQVKLRDHESGFEMEPLLPADADGRSPVMSLLVPGNIAARKITLQAEPGAIFYGIHVEQEQMYDGTFKFDHTKLPPV